MHVRGRPADDAEQRADGELRSGVDPWLELFPGPLVHPDFAVTAAFAAPYEQRAAPAIEVAIVQQQGFVDAQPGAPQNDDQSA